MKVIFRHQRRSREGWSTALTAAEEIFSVNQPVVQSYTVDYTVHARSAV